MDKNNKALSGNDSIKRNDFMMAEYSRDVNNAVHDHNVKTTHARQADNSASLVVQLKVHSVVNLICNNAYVKRFHNIGN